MLSNSCYQVERAHFHKPDEDSARFGGLGRLGLRQGQMVRKLDQLYEDDARERIARQMHYA